MDEIQKILVKAGRKDLAQKYYQKVSNTQQILGNVTEFMQRKESSLDLVKKRINPDDLTDKQIETILQLPRFTTEQLYGSDWDNSLEINFRINSSNTWFIMTTADGNEYLVDTEGYTYARYIAQIDSEELGFFITIKKENEEEKSAEKNTVIRLLGELRPFNPNIIDKMLELAKQI